MKPAINFFVPVCEPSDALDLKGVVEWKQKARSDAGSAMVGLPALSSNTWVFGAYAPKTRRR